jgi:hypothetical protein
MGGRAAIEWLPDGAQPTLDRGEERWATVAQICSRSWWLFTAEAHRSFAYDHNSARARARMDDQWSKFYPRGGW